MLELFSLNASAHLAGDAPSKPIRAITTLLLILLICSVVVCPNCSAGSASAEKTEDQSAAPSVACIERLGLAGTIAAPGVLMERLAVDGPEVIFMTADDALYAISNGKLLWCQTGVHSMALIDDITGDGARDIVISRWSSISGHDGATGERIWQSSPKQRLFERDLGWSDRGFEASDVQVIRSDDSEIVAVTSGRCLFGLSAQDGYLLWQFEGSDTLTSIAAVTDRNEDGAEELVAGTSTGFVYLVRGGTGKAKWKKKVGEEWMGEYGQLRHGSIDSIASFDGEGSAVIIATGDGRICLMDLQRGDIEWENRLVDREAHDGVRMWPLPDATGDGLPEILADTGMVASEGSNPLDAGQGITSISEGLPPTGGTSTTVPIQSSGSGSGQQLPLRRVAMLSGANGEQVWTTQLYFTDYSGPEIAHLDGQPVLLEPHPQLGITMVSLKDGSVMKSVKIATLDGKTPQARQLADGKYLVFSNGSDLAVVSADGSVQWYYPRVSSTVVEKGQFTSDAIPDLLVCGESAQPSDQATATRLISAVDGATRKVIWRFEAPWVDFSTIGGLSSVQVAGDLTGDGMQDVVAYRASTVFRFSGADGSLARFEIDESIVNLQSVKMGTSTNAILVETEGGLLVLDRNGNTLWESAYADWSSAELKAILVLNDLNQDSASDLAMVFADRILVAMSVGMSPLAFETHRSMAAGENKAIELKGLANDIDGDGVQEVAYFEYDKDKTEADGVLMVVSPATGDVRYRWSMPVTVDLACADFNGDGFRDSLVYHSGPKVPAAIVTTASRPLFGQAKLEIYSGQDGSVLWSHTFDADWWNAGSEKMPAAPAGDVTGDAVEDLALSSVVTITGSHSNNPPHETRLRVYDVVGNFLVRQVVLPPAQKTSDIAADEGHYGDSTPVSGPGDVMRLAGDLNGDGHRDLAVLAGYLTGSRFAWAGHSVALVDVHGERVLGYCSRLTTLDFFETGSANTIGFTDGSALYLARLNDDLRVTSPGEGATVGSHARIAWEGSPDSASLSVFVDGYENAQTRGSEVTLLLTPGEHEVVIRSVDGFGIVTYAAVEFRVSGSPWVSILAAMSVLALLLLYFAARFARVLQNRRAQRAES